MSKMNERLEQGFDAGTEIFNTQTGEVMTYCHRAYNFTGGNPGVVEYVYGYDDYARILEWPYEQAERV
jgi:hypothetical protein